MPTCRHFRKGFCKEGANCRWIHHAKSGNALSGGPAARDGELPCAPRDAPCFPAAPPALATTPRPTPTPPPYHQERLRLFRLAALASVITSASCEAPLQAPPDTETLRQRYAQTYGHPPIERAFGTHADAPSLAPLRRAAFEALPSEERNLIDPAPTASPSSGAPLQAPPDPETLRLRYAQTFGHPPIAFGTHADVPILAPLRRAQVDPRYPPLAPVPAAPAPPDANNGTPHRRTPDANSGTPYHFRLTTAELADSVSHPVDVDSDGYSPPRQV
jgi:hypothetical protein